MPVGIWVSETLMKFKSQNCGPLQAQSLGHSSFITKCNKLQHIDLKERKNKSQSIFNVTSCELWHLLYNSFMLWFLHQLPSQQTPTKVWELLELHTFSLSEAGFQKALNWTKIERRVGWGRERDSSKARASGIKTFFQWESMNWKVIYGIHIRCSWSKPQKNHLLLLQSCSPPNFFLMTFDLSQRFSKSQTPYFRLFFNRFFTIEWVA